MCKMPKIILWIGSYWIDSLNTFFYLLNDLSLKCTRITNGKILHYKQHIQELPNFEMLYNAGMKEARRIESRTSADAG